MKRILFGASLLVAVAFAKTNQVTCEYNDECNGGLCLEGKCSTAKIHGGPPHGKLACTVNSDCSDSQSCFSGTCETNPPLTELKEIEGVQSNDTETQTPDIEIDEIFGAPPVQKCQSDKECTGGKRCIKGCCKFPVFAEDLLQHHVIVDQVKKCKADGECKPKRCNKGICCNPTFAFVQE
ncbi:UNKNOWN [Stylonychia lemnae]|uniref:Uncharacterized protein n=1 Tax=Stylonychia lemnae TaxID=5949 RepID=A0A078B0Z2_STYLE|nr:UNKNOWN [Stylonychia lemnae]|eukprot:CDW87022.1 UNKNOWN [Stylonychia lemnae]